MSAKDTPKKSAAKKKAPLQIKKPITRMKKGLDKKKPEEITKNEDFQVRFVFTDEEINIKAKKMADHNNKIQTLVDELDSVKNQFKYKIDAERSAFNELMGHISAGYEYKKVQCVVKMNDPEPGKKTYYYQGEPVYNGVEQMLSTDFQTVIKFAEAKTEDQDMKLSYDIGTQIWEVTNAEKLKDVFLLQKETPYIETVDDFLDKSKRLAGAVQFGTSSEYTGQTLRQHLSETKNLELFLDKVSEIKN